MTGLARTLRQSLLLPILGGFVACGGDDPDAPEWELLFDGESLDGWEPSRFGGEGEIEIEAGRLILRQGSPLTGITWTGPAPPTDDYELSFRAARRMGTDFFAGLTFPVRDDHCTLILGGWGGAVVGLSCLDGRDASENETTQYRGFERGQAVGVRVRVAAQRIRVWLDDERVIDVDVEGREVSMRPEVDRSKPLGVAAFATEAEIGPIRIRRLTERHGVTGVTER